MAPGGAGEPNLSLDEHRAALRAVTVADLHDVAQEAHASALLMVPEGTRADWAGFVAAPTVSEAIPAGTTHRSRDDDGQLRVGPDGISYLGDGGPLTVRYADCAVMLAWPDGARQLIGHDAIVLHVEPTLFDLRPPGLALLDTAVPADRQVAMPPRDPQQIPQPGAAREYREHLARPRRAWWETLLMALSGLATLGIGGLTLLLTIGMFMEPAVGATAGCGVRSPWAGCSLLSSRCPSCCWRGGDAGENRPPMLAGDRLGGIRSARCRGGSSAG
ncbi:hypothetical protein [Micromonospora craniellae]|uniref:Uncharacterized protein n=1 Tax=Micromonospora craniellae TaxID=2294034 RepID=A0A372FRB7_9ACTN|nr:hypothetical protein [Micromonospora craniellae]QOC90831.1 hypothetical protein ID554_22375 [Micromonospora craniellae]RFS43327.1 hypothetical protein D0Q02_28485 [Micromonospora craniellae]